MLQTVLAAPAICTAPAAELAAPALGPAHALTAYEAAHTLPNIPPCFSRTKPCIPLNTDVHAGIVQKGTEAQKKLTTSP